MLYDYWYSGGLPVAGSETVCLDLVDFALEAGLKLGVHYCSLENKHTGQIYKQNSGQNLPSRMYFSQKDYFLKTAKVFGEDIPAVKQVFDKSGYRDYIINEQHNLSGIPCQQDQQFKKNEYRNWHFQQCDRNARKRTRFARTQSGRNHATNISVFQKIFKEKNHVSFWNH